MRNDKLVIPLVESRPDTVNLASEARYRWCRVSRASAEISRRCCRLALVGVGSTYTVVQQVGAPDRTIRFIEKTARLVGFLPRGARVCCYSTPRENRCGYESAGQHSITSGDSACFAVSWYRNHNNNKRAPVITFEPTESAWMMTLGGRL
jgi:hypothetical protein